ncbi:MAG: hypothetical protein Q7S02_04215 [bacterium]|nr:hypothetical protein [bacterium]
MSRNEKLFAFALAICGVAFFAWTTTLTNEQFAALMCAVCL